MSLFKAREWWATKVGEEEIFDLGCMAVGNVDNASSPSDKIVVGSYHGVMRIYKPHKSEEGDSYNAQDLLVETQLSQPILQIEIGKFLSGSDNLHIAVLHSRKLGIYTLSVTSGQVEHGVQYQLKSASEQDLERTACNMCHGAFGGVKGKDFICVQSMDGALSIFEQENYAFTRYLPKALIPGPLRYIAKTDSFVTVSSSRILECYKYKVLAIATDVKSKEEAENVKSGKKVVSDWELNIGEQAIDVHVVALENCPLSIYVLGERNLFITSETGKLRQMKKFDYNPSCILPYATVSSGKINCMIGTHTNTLLIYKDVTLQWSAQLTQWPVQLKVASFQDLKGVIVSLSEDGHLNCMYLGTDPSMFTAPTSEVREIDYDDLNEEMAKLQKVIKEQQRHVAIDLPEEREDSEIQMHMEVSPELDANSRACDSTDYEEELTVPSIGAKVIIKAALPISEVRISLHIAEPLFCEDILKSYSNLDADRHYEWDVHFYKRGPGVVPTLIGELTATYKSCSGAPRVYHCTFRLPLKLVCASAMPSKTATYKLTIDTNKPPVSLSDIFPDMLGEALGTTGNALGFRYYGTVDVITILASKTSQRYRLQCDAFENLWLLIDEIARRLAFYMSTHGLSDFCISYDGQLPLQEFFEVLDAHFNCRQEEAQLSKMLDERAIQFRAIQRRLLTRFKDKTPVPLANLDVLLNGTYNQLLSVGDDVEVNRGKQEQLSRNLSAAVRILLFMIRVWQDMADNEFAVLESAITPNVDNNSQLENGPVTGWEEMVDASVTHLLRTCLAKSTKDTTVNPSPLTLLKDTQKLKKHIALVCDRLSKGSKLIIEGLEVRPKATEHQHILAHKAKGGSKMSLRSRSSISVGRAPSVNDFSKKASGIEPGTLPSIPGAQRGGDNLPTILTRQAVPEHEEEHHGALGGIGGGGGLNRFLKQDSSGRLASDSPSARSEVPDLDDMEGGGGYDEAEKTGGSTGEKIYGLNEDDDMFK